MAIFCKNNGYSYLIVGRHWCVKGSIKKQDNSRVFDWTLRCWI